MEGWKETSMNMSVSLAATCRCVIDFKPRNLDAAICNLLFNFAALVVREIERADHTLRWQKAMDPTSGVQKPDELTDLDYMTDVTMILDVQSPDWKILYANNCLEDVTGLSRAQVTGNIAWESFVLAGKSKARLMSLYLLQTGSCLSFRMRPAGRHMRKAHVACT